MNVSAAPALPASPVADGSVTAAGQADAPATGFDALLALVDAAAAGVAGAANDSAPVTPDAAPADKTDPSAAPSDAMMAALAAMMMPAPTPIDTTVPATAATAANDAVFASPVVQADLAAPAPLFPTPEAANPAAAPAPLTAAIETAQAEIAALPPLAASTTAPTRTEAAATTPAALSATTAAAAAPAVTHEVAKAKAETPARPAAAPVSEAGAEPAAKAVKTETAEAVTAIAGGAGKDAADPGLPQTATAAATPAPAGAPTATDAASTPAPVRTADMLAPVAEAVAVVRGSPDTVAKLSADILKKLDGRSTRFEIALDPVGLGRVDVKMEIAGNGQVTAALSFDTAHAASELRGRAHELRHALQQAGFDLPESALSFDVGSQAGGDGRGAQTAWDFEGRGQGRGGAFAGRAFEAVLNGGESLVSDLSTRFGAPRADGVDVRI